MVVFSSTDISEKLVDRAVTLAKDRDARLIILDVRDRAMADRVADFTEDVGFMGEKVVSMLRKEISQERCDVIFQRLSIIEEKAKKNNVPYEIAVEKGPFIEGVLKVAKKKNVKTIICQKREEALVEEGFEVIQV